MSTIPVTAQTEKWAKPSMTHTVEFFHNGLRQLVADKLAASGKEWAEVVDDPAYELTLEDFEQLDAQLLATGYRYEMSAQISLVETPEKYRAVDGLADTGADERNAEGLRIIGNGANVFRAAGDVVGTAKVISSVETVMELLLGGVPEHTIAVIDDSGGTLTAPILEHFAGVLCMGGTVRSHLGILTREYNVPCLMDVQLDGLKDGDRIRVEYSKPPADVYAENDPNSRSLVLKLEGDNGAQ